MRSHHDVHVSADPDVHRWKVTRVDETTTRDTEH